MRAAAEAPRPHLTRRLALGAGRAGWFVRAILAALCGGIAVVALPPLYIVPAVLPAFIGLLWLIAASRHGRSAFAVGWWFGFAYFGGGLYWVSEAFLVDPEKFGWMVPIAVPALAAGLALFIGLAALLTHLSRTTGVARIIIFAAAWTVAEWLRGIVLTGFPWNLTGSVWAWSEAMIQVVALVGAYGLSFLTVLCAALPATLAERAKAADGTPRPSRWDPVWAAFLIPLALYVGGTVRLMWAENGYVADVKLRIVQANIDQRKKWRSDQRRFNFDQHLRLTRAPGIESVTHVIWPESAMPYFLSDNDARRREMAAVVPKGGLIVTGTTRRARVRGRTRYWNSLQAVDGSGQIVGTYDKHHLVPFGEYVPLRNVLPLSQIAASGVDFSAGPGPRTLRLPGLPPVSPMICYEAIFPGNVVADGHRPGWLLNVTNDGWFGESAGPYQHYASARLRAVEEGLPLVRAANTGISVVFDPYGRVIGRIGLGEEEHLDVRLPSALPRRPPFAIAGNWALALLLLLATGVAYGLQRRKGGARPWENGS